MRIMAIGDIHGSWGMLNTLINKQKPDIILQCGDWGWFPSWDKQYVKDSLGIKRIWDQYGVKNADTKIYWCDGNHECLSKDTEILTESGWINIQSVTVDSKIGVVDLTTNELSFEKPDALVSKYVEKIIQIEGDNMKQKVSYYHDVIYDNRKIKAIDILEYKKCDEYKTKFIDDASCEYLVQSKFPLCCQLIGDMKSEIPINILLILLWIICDATIIDYSKHNTNSNKLIIQFKLSKESKIKRITELLNYSNIRYTITPAKMSKTNVIQSYYIRIYADDARYLYHLLNNSKKLPRYLLTNVSKSEFDTIVNELSISDGSKSFNRVIFKSTQKDNVDMIQELCVRNGFNSVVNESDENIDAFGDKKIYSITIYMDGVRNQQVQTKELDYNDFVYCVVTKMGIIVTRVDGKVAITGNCHWSLRDLTNNEVMPNVYYMKRGSIITLPNGMDVMFMGGANSIDKNYRKIGVDWFPEEVIRQQDIMNLPDRNVDLVISHTCPNEFLKQFSTFKYDDRDPSRVALSYILERYRPKQWYFGHWHFSKNGYTHQCNWTALNMAGDYGWWKWIEK